MQKEILHYLMRFLSHRLTLANALIRALSLAILLANTYSVRATPIQNVEIDIKTFELNITRTFLNPDCSNYTGQVLLVNNQLPGPTIAVTKGDRIRVVVRNLIKGVAADQKNIEDTALGGAADEISIHFHGIRQVGSVAADGVPYVTQVWENLIRIRLTQTRRTFTPLSTHMLTVHVTCHLGSYSSRGCFRARVYSCRPVRYLLLPRSHGPQIRNRLWPLSRLRIT